MAVYFEFEVVLLDVKSRMWRRFLLFAEGTFGDLHHAIQDACGWTNSHLFEFGDASGRNSIAVSEHFEESDSPCVNDVPLSCYFDRNQSCRYQYDFGDRWEHVVELKGKSELKESFERRLLDGDRTFPPEDCGGTWGYEECFHAATISDAELQKLDALAREDILARRAWLGDWRPDAFDLKAAKKRFDQ